MTQRRENRITEAAACGGTCRGGGTETKNCAVPAKLCQCVLGAWSAWSACTAQCGPGTKTRKQKVDTSKPYVSCNAPSIFLVLLRAIRPCGTQVE